MDENINFDNFNDIWQRVKQRDEYMPDIADEQKKPEPTFIVKQCPRSRCIRFLPSF